jgi:hypothetical protein
MPAAFTIMLSVQVSDFEDNCLLIQHDRLICDSCSSGQRFACSFLQPTPRDVNLAVRLTLPPVGCVEDLHLQVSAPCRAHNLKKAGPDSALPFLCHRPIATCQAQAQIHDNAENGQDSRDEQPDKSDELYLILLRVERWRNLAGCCFLNHTSEPPCGNHACYM